MNLGTQPILISRRLRGRVTEAQINDALREPLIILSAPRSGSTLLFEYLTHLAGTSWIGGESHRVYRHFPHLGIANAAFDSASLDESHAAGNCKTLFRDAIAHLLRDSTSLPFAEDPVSFLSSRPTFIEKTPRNALNIPFLNAVFPDARYIFLYRSPAENVASIMEAWSLGLKTGRFVTFPKLPGWDRARWCFLLPPGWRGMIGKSLAEIATFQWQASNQTILDNLSRLPKGRSIAVSYEAMLGNPQEELARLLRFIGIPHPEQSHTDFASILSTTTISAPQKDKWRRFEEEIATFMPELEGTLAMMRTFEKACE
ncbi:MAG: sulfotransferase [Proteobacteria bacterium]|nr:sulfotransferase [Pseudomonadota bacterium]